VTSETVIDHQVFDFSPMPPDDCSRISAFGERTDASALGTDGCSFSDGGSSSNSLCTLSNKQCAAIASEG